MHPWTPLLFLGVALAQPVLKGPIVLDTPGAVLKDAVIQGSGKGTPLVLRAPGIRVENLLIRGVGKNTAFYEPDAGIHLEGCEGCVAQNIRVETQAAALRVEDSPGAYVEGIVAQGGEEAPGIFVHRSRGIVLRKNRLKGFSDGIYVEYSPKAQILENEVTGSFRYAIHVMFGSENLIQGNRIYDNRVGSAVMHGANNRVLGNLFLGHRLPLAFGLLVQGEAGGEFSGNTFRENSVGLLLLSSQGGVYAENAFLKNTFAVLVQREGLANQGALFRQNRFLGNVYDLAVDDPEARLRLQGNTYDRANPLDLDQDGVSDLPHLPASTFALWVSRHPPLSLFAESPAVLVFQEAEKHLPGLQLASLADPRPRQEASASSYTPGLVLLAGVFLGGALWWKR